MNRNANQIAAEHARREQREQEEPRWDHQSLQPPRPDPVEPKRGTLTVLSGLGGAATVLGTYRHVIAQFTSAGLIIAVHEDGSKVAFQPIPGWAILFEPDDAEG